MAAMYRELTGPVCQPAPARWDTRCPPRVDQCEGVGRREIPLRVIRSGQCRLADHLVLLIDLVSYRDGRSRPARATDLVGRRGAAVTVVDTRFSVWEALAGRAPGRP